MNGTPTVSVVLIFYNDARFLPESIESVFLQTYTDWELILADDGSTDESTEIARRWSERFPRRVRYVCHPDHENLGPSAARNLGVRHARGTFVATLDSDDLWEPDKLTEQVRILEANPAVEMLFGASLYWWSWAGENAQRADRLVTIGAPPDRVHHPPTLSLLLYPLGRGVAPCPSSWLIRRTLIDRIGGWEEHLSPVYEDQGFLAKAYTNGSIWVSSQCLDRYRRHPGQIVETTTRTAYHEARHGFLAWYASYLEEQGLGDTEVGGAVDRATWPYRHPRLAGVKGAAARVRTRVWKSMRSL